MKGETHMYNYKLSNNHYIIDIEGRMFLLDTGSQFSFSFKRDLRDVVIDGTPYPLHPKPDDIDLDDTYELVGMELDGMIGLDIIYQTSLTIYKDGRIDFKKDNEHGIELPLDINMGLRVKVKCNGVTGCFFIDTGAKYGYGCERLFQNSVSPVKLIKDYNPRHKHFQSQAYNLTVDFGPVQKEYLIGDSEVVRKDLAFINSILIANITPLFNEVCVIDIRNGTLTIR